MASVSEKILREIFLLLVKEAGASPEDLPVFLDHMKKPFDGPREFSFRGKLGFGGKFYLELTRFRVSCYPEDRSPEREAIIAKVNERLETLRKEETHVELQATNRNGERGGSSRWRCLRLVVRNLARYPHFPLQRTPERVPCLGGYRHRQRVLSPAWRHDKNRQTDILRKTAMNFSEIPLYPRAHYEIDAMWDYMEEILGNYIANYGLQLLPDFQRGHVWTEQQQISYVEYVLRGGESGKTILFNHPDWNNPLGNGEFEFVIVDGLQRLTAARRFMGNEIRAFGHLFREFTGNLRMHVGFKFRVLSLPDRASVLTYYLAFNEGGTVHSEHELKRVKALLDEETKKNEKCGGSKHRANPLHVRQRR